MRRMGEMAYNLRNCPDENGCAMELSQHPLFKNLTPEAAAEAQKWAQMGHHPRGEFLFHAGDIAENIYLLLDGIVKVSYFNPGGDEKIISLAQTGDIFGELFLGSYPHRIGTAYTLTPAVTARLTRANLFQMIQRSPQVGLNLVGHLADEQRETLARLHALMHVDARHRLLGTLLSVGRRFCCLDAEWLELPASITQQDLANLACLNRSTVNIYINELRSQGVLGGRGRQLTLNRRVVEALLLEAGLEILQ